MSRSFACPLLLGLLITGCGPAESEPSGKKADPTDTVEPTDTTDWSSTVGEFDDAGGLSGNILNPFPNPWLITDGHVDIPADQLPQTNTPFPAVRVSHRTGFSPAQVVTLRIPNVSCVQCPSWQNPTPGEGSVLMWDRTTNEFLPVMAELDAYPGADSPTLLIRPQTALADGHDIGIVVTTAAVPRPQRFQNLIDGADSIHAEHYADLMTEIGTMGINVDDVALAWDFPVGGANIKLTSAVSQVEVPTNWDFLYVKNADQGDNVPGPMWRVARGYFNTTDFMSNNQLALNNDGTVNVTGMDDPPLIIAIPDSVKDAPAGSVPVILYGHSLLSSAKIEVYDFYGAIHDIAEDLGMIVIATNWGGLDSDDLLTAINVANDFGKMPRLTGAMVQGQANQQGLVKLAIDGDLFDDPVFEGVNGQKLANPSDVNYWGMSLGGILGGVFMAQDGPINAGVLNIGGGGWASLLERSTNWNQFEFMIVASIPAAEDRQLMYAVSQLYWDDVDPMSYTESLSTRTVLMQESLGDDAVCNMSSRTLARSIDLPVLSPEVDLPWGMNAVAADLPAGSRAIVQFDSERELPPDINRPADFTGAHTATTWWNESIDQAVDFLTPGFAGQVNHYCGNDPCTASTIN